MHIHSLAPGRYRCKLKLVTLQLKLRIGILSICSKIDIMFSLDNYKAHACSKMLIENGSILFDTSSI